jgi:hypothetical protein
VDGAQHRAGMTSADGMLMAELHVPRLGWVEAGMDGRARRVSVVGVSLRASEARRRGAEKLPRIETPGAAQLCLWRPFDVL